MRPIKLEMTAFGSYKAKETIDFSLLGDGIYAITGPTGAGKTTIFDALMFALYEEVSSKGVDSKENPVESNSVRSKNMVRNKQADEKTDTVVSLEFEEHGRKYKVIRTIHVTPRNTLFKAELEGEDIAAVTGSGKVTAEITRILGDMNATRFRQIVMLAQGQFRAFMEARDEKRKEILSKMFDSEPYQIMQERLKGARENLEKQKQEKEEKIRIKLQPDVFLMRPETDSVELARYSADLPTETLKENLQILVEKDKKVTEDIKKEELNIEDRAKVAERRMGKAESDNKQYAELQKKKESLNRLNSIKEEVDQNRKNLEDSEKALRAVYPKAEEKERIVRDMEENSRKLLLIEDNLRKAEKKCMEAEAEEAENPERKKRAEDLGRDIALMEDHMKDFRALAEAEKRKKESERDRELCIKLRRQAEEDETGACKRLEEIEEELKKTVNAEAEKVKAGQEYKNAFEIIAKLNELGRALGSLHKEEENVRGALAAAEVAGREEKLVSDRYFDIHRRYLEGYAGKLGLELGKKLSEEGIARCPVCNSEFHRDEQHSFAEPAEETVSDSELERAEQAMKSARKESAEKTGEAQKKKTAFEEKKNNLVNELNSRIPDFAPWELTGKVTEKRFEEALTERKRREEECKQSYNNAVSAVELKERLTAEKEAIEKERGEKARQKNKADSDLIKADGNIRTSAEKISVLEEAIKGAGMDVYADETAATAELKEKKSRKELIENEIQKIAENSKTAENRKSEISGERDSLNRLLNEIREKLDKAQDSYRQALKDSGFSEEQYGLALSRIKGENREQWIKNERQKILDYENSCINTMSRIKELEALNITYTDMKKLKEEVEEISREKKVCGERRDNHRRFADSHIAALNTLNETSEELKIVSGALERVRNLSGVANGENSEGGKRTFDGYVLGNTFREVLGHATKYLDEMTGGSYAFYHDTEAANARKASYANFHIQVEDKLANEMREIGSLSGGEGFQAAMALALGLSETVQSHAASVSIDTMFIDEGFGTLDKDSLHSMMHMLNNLPGGQRQIGIISHVDELREDLGKFIHVTKAGEKEGSHLRIEV